MSLRGEATLEGQQRVIVTTSASSEMQDRVSALARPRSSVVEQQLEWRQRSELVVRPDEVCLHDAVVLGEQTGRGRLPLEIGDEQVKFRAESQLQGAEVVDREEVRTRRVGTQHGCSIQLCEFADRRPRFVGVGCHAGAPGARDLLAQTLAVRPHGGVVVLAEVDRDGLAELQDRWTRIGADGRHVGTPAFVPEQRMEPGERAEGPLAAPDGNDRVDSASREPITRLAPPRERAGISVDRVDVGPFGVFQSWNVQIDRRI